MATAVSAAAGTSAPSLLERTLRVFADVRPGEGPLALLMTTNLFLLLVGYYVAKTVREPLILLTGGAEMASYASAAQAVTLMGFIPFYGWLASRVERVQLITWVLLVFLACVELFNIGLRMRVPYLGFVFFVWVGIFSLATIAQFWSYANDVYSREKGERLFPLIALGATAGSPVGAKLAGVLFERGTTAAEMLHLTAILLLIHVWLYHVVNARIQREPTTRPVEPLAGAGGFTLVLRSGYLQLAALLLILLNLVNSNGEYIIRHAISAAATEAVLRDPTVNAEALIGAFSGDYQFWGAVIAVILQALLASRLVKLGGFPLVLVTLPLISLGTYGLIGTGVAFAVVRWAKTAENATDYSIMNTARQMLWLPTSRDEKYKAKQTLDTFFVRTGDVVSAGFVFAGTAWLGLDATGFARVNVVVVLAWLAVAALLIRRWRALASGAASKPAQ